MIVDSSIWEEPDFVCKIFVTMLALKDSDDVCRVNAYQLGRRSHKTETEVLEALRILSSPDSRRLEEQPHDGRRIMATDDGWMILNGEKYREMMQDEMRKARWRRAQAKKRAKDRESKESATVSQFAGKNVKAPHNPPDDHFVPARPRTTHDPQWNGHDTAPEPIEKSAEQFIDENL
jgi:hypothetical protein